MFEKLTRSCKAFFSLFALSLSLKNEIRFLLCISFPSSSCGLACVSCEGLTIASCVKKTNAHSSNISSCFASQFKNLTFENLKFFLGYNDCSRGASNANWNQKRRKRYACWIHIMQAWMAQAAGWTSSKYYCTYLTLQDHVRSRSVSIQTEVVLVEFKILMSAENC